MKKNNFLGPFQNPVGFKFGFGDKSFFLVLLSVVLFFSAPEYLLCAGNSQSSSQGNSQSPSQTATTPVETYTQPQQT